MTDAEQVQQALAELWDVVKCRCNEAYTGRGLHDPDCECDSTDALQIVTDRIEALTAKLAKAVEALEWCATVHDSSRARATLAEIKGENHE